MLEKCKKKRARKEYWELYFNGVYARGNKISARPADIENARLKDTDQARRFIKHFDAVQSGKIKKGEHLFEIDAQDSPYCICGIVSEPLAFHYIP